MTTIYIVSGTTFTAPGDWPGSATSVECIGGGSAGEAGNNTPGCGIGGGAGAYSKKNGPVTFANGQALHIGPGGTTHGQAGGDTYLGSSLGGSLCGAQGGQTTPVSGTTAAQGGAAGSGIGDVKNNGGNGGLFQSGFADNPTGGGGAGGPSGPGAAGGASGTTAGGGTGGGGADNGSSPGTQSSSAPTAGGNNNASTGGGTAGTSGTPAGGAGSAGGGGGGGFNAAGGSGGNGSTENLWDSTHGPGSGGGGNNAGLSSGASSPPGNGGLYGGGGGGGGAGSYTAFGTGAQGIIVITYTPAGVSTILMGQACLVLALVTAGGAWLRLLTRFIF